MYPESVEEIVVTPTLEKTSGETALFHAAGREDIDAKMLGRGRPFVVEVKKPKKRYIDLKILEKNINEKSMGKVTVLDLQSVKKNAVSKLKKMESTEKSYKTLVKFSRTILDDEIRNLDKVLTNTIVRQQTPLRVLHRRSDRIREKHIYEAKTKRLTSNCIEMRIRCQGGLYIKELITGDEGRTNPSVTELVGAMATPQKLDVLSVGN
jgi:tRNA pseudouridine synthase 10